MSELTGLTGLFLTSFLASTLLPGGSEAALLLAAFNEISSTTHLWWVSTLGNTLGGMTNWLLGFWLAHKLCNHPLQKPSHQRALNWIQQYGAPLLLLSWLPIIGDPLCLAAGWSRIRWYWAILFIAIGKGVRYALILFAANV